MFTIALHGGAGTISRDDITPDQEKAYRAGLDAALNAGHAVLSRGGSALDAAIEAVVSLENNELFNAGKGAVFTAEGTHEMDAAVMRGDTLDAGAVAGIRGVRNPIRLAWEVMEASEYVFRLGRGAEAFARERGQPFEPDDYFFTEQRQRELREAQAAGRVQLDHSGKKKGTVGAVALDRHGTLAAATSTGGLTNKKWGRVGDSPVIGAGTYANNATCAVSCTGVGEAFLKAVAAYDVSCLMEYRGYSLQQACDVVVLEKLKQRGGEGGLVAVDGAGNAALVFNSEGMYRAWRNERGEGETAIFA